MIIGLRSLMRKKTHRMANQRAQNAKKGIEIKILTMSHLGVSILKLPSPNAIKIPKKYNEIMNNRI